MDIKEKEEERRLYFIFENMINFASLHIITICFIDAIFTARSFNIASSFVHKAC